MSSRPEGVIRPATAADAPGVRAVYAPIVETTPISFEEEVPSMAELERRIESSLEWLVLDINGTVTGYAYAGPFHRRAAYRWSAEISVYVGESHRGTGAGKLLVEALLERLRDRGYVNAFAGVTLPNAASEGLFASFGFRQIARQEHVGYKLGAWHDVGWWQLDLRPPSVPPPDLS